MNVNEATREELLTLDGVGDRLARDILSGRPFERLEDLLAVPGIGESRLASLRQQGLTVESGRTDGESADQSEDEVEQEERPSADDDSELPSFEDLDLPPLDEFDVSQRLTESPWQPPWTQTAPYHQTAPISQTAPVDQTAPEQGRADTTGQSGEADDETERVEEDESDAESPTDQPVEPPAADTFDETTTGAGDAASAGDDAGVTSSRGFAGVFAPGSRKYVGQTLILSAAFYLVLFALYVLTAPPALTEEHVLIALVPFLILLISSGKLREIRGPGGLMLTLQNEARSDVLPEFTEDLEMGEQRPMEKGGAIDPAFEAEIERRRPTSLTFTLGRTGYYDFDVITQYVEVLSRKSPAFRYVVFLEKDDRFAGFVSVADFRAVLDADLASAFRSGASYDYLPGRTSVVERIENGDILNAAGVVTASVRQGSTNEEALELMKEESVDRLAVLDDRDRFLGVVTQERISRAMLLKLLQRSNP